MVTLLRRLKKKDQAEDGVSRTDTRDAEQDVLRLLLLVPAEGGFSFRFFPFPTIEAVAAYVERDFPRRADKLVVFRALHDRPHNPLGENGDPVEAVVLVRDPDRGGVVHLYSFVDMETANAFIRSEGMRGLGLEHVLLFWAEPVTLPAPEEAHAAAAPSQPIPAPVQQWQARPETARAPVARTVVHRTAPPLAPEAPSQAVAPPPPPAIEPEPAPLAVKAPRRGIVHMAPVNGVVPSQAPSEQSQPVAPAAAAATQAPPQPSAEPKPAKAEKAPKPASAKPLKVKAETPENTGEPKKSASGDLLHRVRSWGGWDGLGPHMWSASLARWQTYEEVRKDEFATGRAWLIVGASVFFAAVGGGLKGGPDAFFIYAISAAIAAAMYLGALYVIATLGFGGRLERHGGTLFLQRLGLAASPGVLLLLGVIPAFGAIFVLGAFIWIGFTSVKAVELSLELDRQSAGYTVIFAWFALFGFGAILPLIMA